MKKIGQMFLAATVFAACHSKSDLNTNKDVILTDTSAMYRSNMMTDTGSVIQTTTLRNNSNYSQNNNAVANRRPINNNPSNNSNSVNRNGSSSTANTSNSGSGNSGRTTTVTRRRGWSHAAKDATIGGVGGAVVGAVVSKKHGKGAVIGGVVGAAGGYIIGRGKDKREGRR